MADGAIQYSAGDQPTPAEQEHRGLELAVQRETNEAATRREARNSADRLRRKRQRQRAISANPTKRWRGPHPKG